MSKPFDLLAEFWKFGLERRMSLRDPATISAFTGNVGDRMEGALEDSRLLHDVYEREPFQQWRRLFRSRRPTTVISSASAPVHDTDGVR